MAGLAALVGTVPALAQSDTSQPPPSPPAASADPASAPDPAELAEARAIMTLMFPPEEREATFRSLIEQVVAQLGQAIPSEAVTAGDEGLAAILNKFRDNVAATTMPVVRRHLPEILEATAIAYTHEFDLAELTEIRAVAETPAGRHTCRVRVS